VNEVNTSIKNEAVRLGFDACGFARAQFLEEDATRLKEWLDRGYHGSMNYMENHFEKRTDPRKLVEGAVSVVSVLLNYYTDRQQEDSNAPVISKYAYGTDYHFIMKDRLKKLLEFIDRQFGPVQGRVFVDSAPVLDRAWAQRAGLGWIGKNSNLINRKLGSFVFIGEIILDLELDDQSTPESDFCGSCSLCIDACPTSAILPGRTIDATKCISYQTIENRGEIDPGLKGRFENRLFGCDICQDVCPWNQKAISHKIREFDPAPQLMKMKASDWSALDKPTFNLLFTSSAVNRAGFSGLKRNLAFLEE
jgi:epoxyqueuosine reductase